ncbi:MAG: hypothetical protein ABR577_15575 [Pyrinomonadaceae bacterium]
MLASLWKGRALDDFTPRAKMRYTLPFVDEGEWQSDGHLSKQGAA